MQAFRPPAGMPSVPSLSLYRLDSKLAIGSFFSRPPDASPMCLSKIAFRTLKEKLWTISGASPITSVSRRLDLTPGMLTSVPFLVSIRDTLVAGAPSSAATSAVFSSSVPFLIFAMIASPFPFVVWFISSARFCFPVKPDLIIKSIPLLCDTLQCFPLRSCHCFALHCIAVHATPFRPLHSTALRYNALRCDPLHSCHSAAFLCRPFRCLEFISDQLQSA